MKPIQIGPLTLKNNVLLAPMSGITDLPFRKLASRLGAGLVFSEMIASEQLCADDEEALLKLRGQGMEPFAVQLAGREPYWMGEAARRVEQCGAQIIDINMGCPAKKVTRGLSGSALMRDLDHAMTLVDAVVEAVSIPVSLKMRMGWDHLSLNAPELAVRAQSAGVAMVTVHGRTRCQFYNGSADWAFIKQIKSAVTIPVVVNGDIASTADARESLALSGADGVMIGRGAQGAPWMLGEIAKELAGDETIDRADNRRDQRHLVREHYEETLTHYGRHIGIRAARKHLGWYVEKSPLAPERQEYWRRRLCQQSNPAEVMAGIDEFCAESCGDSL